MGRGLPLQGGQEVLASRCTPSSASRLLQLLLSLLRSPEPPPTSGRDLWRPAKGRAGILGAAALLAQKMGLWFEGRSAPGMDLCREDGWGGVGPAVGLRARTAPSPPPRASPNVPHRESGGHRQLLLLLRLQGRVSVVSLGGKPSAGWCAAELVARVSSCAQRRRPLWSQAWPHWASLGCSRGWGSGEGGRPLTLVRGYDCLSVFSSWASQQTALPSPSPTITPL